RGKYTYRLRTLHASRRERLDRVGLEDEIELAFVREEVGDLVAHARRGEALLAPFDRGRRDVERRDEAPARGEILRGGAEAAAADERAIAAAVPRSANDPLQQARVRHEIRPRHLAGRALRVAIDAIEPCRRVALRERLVRGRLHLRA